MLSHRRRLPATTVSRERCRNAEMLPESVALLRRFLFFLAVFLCCLLLYRDSDALRLLHHFSSSPSSSLTAFYSPPVSEERGIEEVLKDAAMEDGTVILTTLNEAWAAPNSIIDLFLESFRIGVGTRRLLNHLVIIALDRKAYRRCLQIHAHCFALHTEEVDFGEEAYFMTPKYLKMMWARIDFLRSVLEMGFNFVFTDADIMWFRDPFPRFHSDADFQIACDHFLGSSDDLQNRPNGGFNYVKSNNRSIEFYKHWYSSRETYSGLHDQDVLNMIKFDPATLNIGLKMKFLDTAYFGGFCEPSRDLNEVCTMHANCCFGLDSKLHDLTILVQDWKEFLSLPPRLKRSFVFPWAVPQNCSLDSLRRYDPPESDAQVAQHGLQSWEDLEEGSGNWVGAKEQRFDLSHAFAAREKLYSEIRKAAWFLGG